jgi:hypothetical protein
LPGGSKNQFAHKRGKHSKREVTQSPAARVTTIPSNVPGVPFKATFAGYLPIDATPGDYEGRKGGVTRRGKLAGMYHPADYTNFLCE